MEVFMKYTLEIAEDLLAELSFMADQMNTDLDTLINACIKAKIIESDVFYSLINKVKL